MPVNVDNNIKLDGGLYIRESIPVRDTRGFSERASESFFDAVIEVGIPVMVGTLSFALVVVAVSLVFIGVLLPSD